LEVISTDSLFFTACPFKGSAKLSKILMVHHRLNDTGSASTTDARDTYGAGITGIIDTRKVMEYYWQVSTTPTRQDLTVINDTDNAYIFVVIDTGDVHLDAKLNRNLTYMYQTYLILNLCHAEFV
jgi:hypothetical protein